MVNQPSASISTSFYGIPHFLDSLLVKVPDAN